MDSGQALKSDFFGILKPFQMRIDEKIKECGNRFGRQNELREACEYALSSGGKRFRPALVFMIADALGGKADVSEAALAVEFFHTASLIADDLPCMDDDDERRNRPALHIQHGEATALLVSYALIAAGYECLSRNAEILKHSETPFAHMSDRICVLALENSTYNTGLHGATGGQFLDIYPPDLKLSTIREVIHKKTVSLFEISFVFGWLYGGGDPAQLEKIKKAASHFGMAFQIADDLGDMEQDEKNQRKVNVANLFGKEKAVDMLNDEVDSFFKTIDILHIRSSELQQLGSLLKVR